MPTENEDQIKACSICAESKPVSAFHRDSSRSTGLADRCKECKKLQSAARYQEKSTEVKRRRKDRYAENRQAILASQKEKYAENPQRYRGTARQWAQNNAEKLNAYNRLRRFLNPELIRTQSAILRIKNSETLRRQKSQWKAENRHIGAASAAKRRAAKLFRTPSWLTPEDRKLMAGFYRYARLLSELTGISHHVDHFYPLQGEFVSGLHVPENLQVVTALENLRKGRSYVPS